MACHAMVRHREPRGQGEWAGAGRLVRPAPVSTVRSRAMWSRAPCAPGPLQECATGSHGAKGSGKGPGAKCWEETRQEYSTRLKRCCEHINDEHDVDAL